MLKKIFLTVFAVIIFLLSAYCNIPVYVMALLILMFLIILWFVNPKKNNK